MLEHRSHISEGGRVVIPAFMRKELQIEIGDEVILRMEGGEIHVSTLARALKSAQDTVKKYARSKTALTDELFKLRKEESDNE